MDHAILTVFHDAHMVNGAISAPVKEDDVPGYQLISARLALPLCLEPVHAVGAEGELRDNPRLDVATLLCAPTHKAGTPFHAATKAVPRPVGLSSLLPHLGQCQAKTVSAMVMSAGIPKVRKPRR